MRPCSSTTLLIALVPLVLASHADAVRAEQPPPNPKPGLSWEERLRCELVFVGKYVESRESKTVALVVTTLVRGPDIRVGDVVPVGLGPWYGVRVRGGPAPARKEIPNLIYGHPQWHDRWGRQLRSLDISQPHLYFIKSAQQPRLERSGEVLEVWQLEEWNRVYAGHSTSRWFRMWNHTNPREVQATWDALAETPDAGVRERLIQGLWRDEGLVGGRIGSALVRLSRTDPMVYDDLLATVRREPPSGHAVSVLVATNPLRALRDIGPWLTSDDRMRRLLAAKALSQVKRRESVVLFAEAIRSPRVGMEVVNSMRSLLSREQWPMRRARGPERESMELALRERVALLVTDLALDPDCRRTLEALNEQLMRARPSLDPKVVVPILKTGAEHERRLMLAEILVTCDLRYLDLLIELARTGRDSTAERAVRHYAWVRPHAFLQAVRRLHLAPVAQHGGLREAWREARTLIGEPQNRTELLTHVSFHRDFQLTERTQVQLAKLYPAGAELKPPYGGVDYWDLVWVRYDHQPAFESIRRRTKTLAPKDGDVPLRHLALGVRVGNHHHAKTLRVAADAVLATASEHEAWRRAVEALWESGDAELRAHALKILDAGGPGSRGAPLATRRAQTLIFLGRHPFDMPTEFHQRLMEAMGAPDRDVGRTARDTISSVFGGWSIYPYESFAHERREAADRAGAMLATALQAGPDDAGAIVLRFVGAKLEGDRSRAWLPELYHIAREGDDTSGVALMLVERILGLRGARESSRHSWGGGWREHIGGLDAWWEDWQLPRK